MRRVVRLLPSQVVISPKPVEIRLAPFSFQSTVVDLLSTRSSCHFELALRRLNGRVQLADWITRYAALVPVGDSQSILKHLASI